MGVRMKRDYIEGKEAIESFENAMKDIFKAPKPSKQAVTSVDAIRSPQVQHKGGSK